MTPRLALLLIIAAETLFFGLTLNQVADHYDYLARIYTSGMYNCESVLQREHARLLECQK